MSDALIMALISAAVKLGEDAAVAIYNAVKAGDVETVKALSAVLPDAHAQTLADEALIAQQRALAGA